MEKIITKAGVMHKRCLSCNECKMSLDASSFYNGFDGEVYCKYCYATKFGHKQKSTYNPSSIKDVMTIQGEKGDANTCPRCLGKVLCHSSEIRYLCSMKWPCETVKNYMQT